MSNQALPHGPNAPFPPPLDQLVARDFSFHPSIANVETNCWRLIDANWSEFLVENVASETQVWVPRRYLGDVSASDRPVIIVGLNRALEHKAGQVWPLHKRVLEMPRPPAGEPVPHAAHANDSHLAQSIRLDPSEKKLGRLILFALLGSVLLVFAVIAIFRGLRSGEMVSYKAIVQENLGLMPDDDYFAVTRKMGEPEGDRWKTDGESVQFRVLSYPKQNLNVILSGRERKDVHYIGALDNDWKVIDSVTQKGGSSTYSVLHRLPRF